MPAVSTRTVRLLLLVLLVGLGVELLPSGPARSAALAEPIPTTEIKFCKEKAGDKGLVESESTNATAALAKDADGKVVENNDKKEVGSYKYTYEILEKAGDKPATRQKRTYEKAQITKDGQVTVLPFQGKTVLIEKKGDKYTYSIEGGKELTAEDAAELAKEFDQPEPAVSKENLLLPGKPVAVGDSWKIKLDLLQKNLMPKFQIDMEQSTATCKLLKVYRKDGKTFGVLEAKADLEVTSLSNAGSKVEFKPGSKLSFTTTMDGCIDGTSYSALKKTTGSLKGNGVLKTPDGKEYSIELDSGIIESIRDEQQPR